MKVTLIHSVYLSHKNGANTVIRQLLANKERFAKNGIDIDGLAPQESTYSSENGGLYAKMRKRISVFVSGILTRMSQHSLWAIKIMIYLREQRGGKMMAKRYLAMHHSKEEVVFIHTLFTCYYYLKYRKEKQKVVLVLHTNGEPFKMQRIYYSKLENSEYYKQMLMMERFVLENVDRIVFVAQKPREVFLSVHPYIESKKVYYVYNGIENTSPRIERKNKRNIFEICCVASITLRKGQHYILEALDEMETKPDVHFTFVGDGSDKERLVEMAKNRGLQKYVKFVGVSNDVESFLNNSDAYILPSEDEGLPMAILEAMRASLPIISTPVGGIPEMLEDGYNGIMIHPSTESIKMLLERINSYDWRNMGVNSRKMFEEKFTVEKMIDEYSKILNFES